MVPCVLQEANVARKRKAASPVKDGPDAKRQAPLEVAIDAAMKAPVVRCSHQLALLSAVSTISSDRRASAE